MRGITEIRRDNTATRVHCESCDGIGQRLLTYTERVTLAVVDRDWQPTATIRARLARRPSPTAMCNRLVDLVRLGLAERRVSEENHRVAEWRRA